MTSGRTVPRFEVIGITGIGEIVAGDGLPDIIASAAQAQGTAIGDGDILVVTQKVVSKAEGRTVDLRDIEPSPLALELAAAADRDPRLVEIVLRESRSIVRMDSDRGIIICETRHGFVCANAGVDTSNVPGEDFVSLLPEDPDRSAREILRRVTELVPACPPGSRHLRHARPGLAGGPDQPCHRRGWDGPGTGLQGHGGRVRTGHEGVDHRGR